MKFAIFVDGSNLVGTLKHLGIRVNDYGALFRYVFRQSVEAWGECLHKTGAIPCELVRTYWYAVGSMDDWDIDSLETQRRLRASFTNDKDARRAYQALAAKQKPGSPQDVIDNEAWQICFREFKEWYIHKKDLVAKFRQFYDGVRRESDFVQIDDGAHWKIEFPQKLVTEKGLDTALAVDMVALQKNYDVAILISGDADNIPSIKYAKRHGKQVGVVEFLSGYPPEKRGKNSSSRLKREADFITQIYEMDLVSKEIGIKQTNSGGASAPAAK